MYGIDGHRELPESTREELSGYAGARPVRMGNGAFDQRQNDVFGAVLDSILLHTRQQPAAAAPAVADRAGAGRVRDAGLARARPGDLGGARQAAALRVVEADVLGGARPRRPSWPSIRGDAELQATWAATAEEIHTDVLAHGVSDDGVLRQHYDTDSLDASTLLGGQLRVPARRRRAAAGHGLRHRLRPDGGRVRAALPHRRDRRRAVRQGGDVPDLLVLAGLGAGRRGRAPGGPRQLMERLLRVASPLGLYAEEFDVDTGRHLGNFPQAFSHLALIEAAARIILPEMLEQY